jgi:branched-chain amino acid aminotransferase
MSEFNQGAAYIDREIVPISEAKISILDWGFLHSDATYDVVHVWNGSFFRLEDHIERFYSGMARLHMSIPVTREQLRAILSNCVKASGLKEAYVEMITTRGLPEPGSRDPRSCTNQFFAFAIPFVWITKPQIGLNLVISQRQRIPEESIDPVVKNYHWLDLVMGQYEAYDLGGETTALIDGNGNITEGPGFNIFVVKDSVILTPRKGILQGITRKTAIELAAIYGYEVIQADVSPDSVRKADEVFATSTAGGIMPITKIDSQTIGSGDIGSVTQKSQEGYWALHKDRRYTSQIDNA